MGPTIPAIPRAFQWVLSAGADSMVVGHRCPAVGVSAVRSVWRSVIQPAPAVAEDVI